MQVVFVESTKGAIKNLCLRFPACQEQALDGVKPKEDAAGDVADDLKD